MDFRALSVRATLLTAAVLAILALAACGGMSNNGGGGGGGGGVTAVAVSPARVGVVASTQTQQFTATVTGDSQNRVTWMVDNIAGGDATVGTISATGLYTPPATTGTHTVTATSTVDTSKSDSSTVGITDFAGVFTYHNNLARDGTNIHEFVLAPSVISTATFGKLFSCAVDGAAYTQPLWVPGLNIGGSTRNVIFVATQHDSLYAFDADQKPCAQLWQINLIDAAHGGTAGETPLATADVGAGYGDIQPEIGVTGTPVIDPATNTLYVLSKSKSGSGPTFHQRLHAINILTGSEKFSGPVNISASVAGNGDGAIAGNVGFSLRTQHQRPGLALVNGVVYVGWAAHEDAGPYHGWLMGYNASTLAQTGVYNSTPNAGLGGIWMGGGAPAADSSNNLFMSTGNGGFDADSAGAPNNDYGDTVIKLNPSAGLTVADWFTPFNQATLDVQDADLAAAGVVLLPDQATAPTHLLVAGGKEGRLYLLNRDSLGHFCGICIDPAGDTNALQTIHAPFLLFGTPAFWQNRLYFAALSNRLSFHTFDTATKRFSVSPVSQSSITYGFSPPIPSISSQGASNGIVWVIDARAYGPPSSNGTGPAVLHAYDATDLTMELWNSNQASGNRDTAGNAVKFTVPTVANGKVYMGTRTRIEVYGFF